MTQFTQNTAMPSSLWQYWRGLSGWNFYFLVKFGLLWAGYLNFHPLLNLVFAAFLLMPIPRYSLHRLRHWIALPIGFALFWHDTWLPGPESIMSQGSQVAGFSTDYLIDLVTRFINWQMIGAIFVLLVAWLFLSQWIRITVFVVAILLWLNVLTLAGPSFSLWPAGQPTTTVTTTGGNAAATVAATGGAPVVGDMPAQTAPPTTANLNAWLNNRQICLIHQFSLHAAIFANFFQKTAELAVMPHHQVLGKAQFRKVIKQIAVVICRLIQISVRSLPAAGAQ